MARPKGFSPAPCPECGNKGRHKVSCPLQGSSLKEKPRPVKPVNARAGLAPLTPNPPQPEGIPMAPVHAYRSEKADYKCAEKGCDEELLKGRQHWVDNSGRHLCIVHAAAEAKRRASPGL